MKSTINKRVVMGNKRVVTGVSILLMGFAVALSSQAPPVSQLVGTITEVRPAEISVRSDAGEIHTLSVPLDTPIKRIAPGQKDLRSAQLIHLGDLSVGDRVLTKINSTHTPAQALQIVAIKQSDLADKQQREREEWMRNGVGGLVKNVDSASGQILLSSGSGPSARTISIHTSSSTGMKRYAPESVRFDQALPAPIDAIHTGDQLRARGTKNSDGSEIAAIEIVSGSFMSLSGMIESIDLASSTLTMKDLATKKQFTIRISAEAQMRRLPDPMAQIIAVQLRSDSGIRPATKHDEAPSTMGEMRGHANLAGQADPQQILNRAPAIQLAGLRKGEAILLVATESAKGVTALTVLAGIEPLLESPAASKNMLSNWSLGSSGGAETAAQ